MTSLRNAPRGRKRSRLLIPSVALTILLFATSLYLALAPYLVLHSMNRYGYEWYHETAPVLGGLALVPALVSAGLTVGARAYRGLGRIQPWQRVTVIAAAMLLSVGIALFLLYWIYAIIYLLTVNWFVF
jgi:hypothetical protein